MKIKHKINKISKSCIIYYTCNNNICNSNIILTRKALNTTIAEFANTVDPYETAHNDT